MHRYKDSVGRVRASMVVQSKVSIRFVDEVVIPAMLKTSIGNQVRAPHVSRKGGLRVEQRTPQFLY